MPSRIEIIECDIITLEVDAIVNSALTNLGEGPGLNGRIHQAAGRKLEQECAQIGPCALGEAHVTQGHNLPAKYIIHAITPIWGGGELNEDNLLQHCYRNALALVKDYDINTIAFSALACDVQNFPKMRAAMIAMDEVLVFLKENTCLTRLIFCCEDDVMVYTYEIAYERASLKSSEPI